MRKLFALFIGLIMIFTSCKKSSTGNYTQAILDTTHILQTIVYKAYATQPSPFDIVNYPLSDSVIVNYNRLVGSPDYLGNAPGVSFAFSPYGKGFGLSYGSLLSIGYDAVPQFPSDFQENEVYENTNNEMQVFISLNRDYAASRRYFITDSVPPDAKDPLVSGPDVTSYCKILISKKYMLITQEGNIKMMDGFITGNCILSYGLTDPTKYLQKWEFSLSFTSLSYYQN